MKGWALHFLALWLILDVSLGQATMKSAYVDADNTLNDVISPDDILFDVRARSRIDCAQLCVSGDNCASSTYYETDTVTSCRGYSTVMTSSAAVTAVAGARTSIRRGKPCPVANGYHSDVQTGLCFKLHYSSSNASAARAACHADGGDLITLDTEDKNAALLRSNPPTTNGQSSWIGLRRPDSLGAFTSSTGPSEYAWTRTGHFLGNVSKFHLGYPFNQPCVCARFESGYYWMNMPCGFALTGFICQIE